MRNRTKVHNSCTIIPKRLPIKSNRWTSPRALKPITPDVSNMCPRIAQLLTGLPPNGYNIWTKQTLIEALFLLEGSGRSKFFANKVVIMGKSKYASGSGITQMYTAWKKKKVIPRGHGRPLTMMVNESKHAVKTSLTKKTQRATPSSSKI